MIIISAHEFHSGDQPTEIYTKMNVMLMEFKSMRSLLPTLTVRLLCAALKLQEGINLCTVQHLSVTAKGKLRNACILNQSSCMRALAFRSDNLDCIASQQKCSTKSSTVTTERTHPAETVDHR